jgi:hypothetical protein
MKNISPNPSSKRGILTILFNFAKQNTKYQTTTVSLFEEGVREISTSIANKKNDSESCRFLILSKI